MTAVFAYRLRPQHRFGLGRLAVGWWTCLFPVLVIWLAQTIKKPFAAAQVWLSRAVSSSGSEIRARHILICGACVVTVATMRFYAAYIAGLVI